jgi:hypothetical protein
LVYVQLGWVYDSCYRDKKVVGVFYCVFVRHRFN